MGTYIALIDFTRQGVDTLDQSPRRAAAFKRKAKKLGAKVRNVYWTLGSRDGVVVFEAPDAQAAGALTLALAREGNVRTEVLTAFGEREIGELIEKSG